MTQCPARLYMSTHAAFPHLCYQEIGHVGSHRDNDGVWWNLANVPWVNPDADVPDPFLSPPPGDPFADGSLTGLAWRLSVLEQLVRDHGVAIENYLYPQAPALMPGDNPFNPRGPRLRQNNEGETR